MRLLVIVFALLAAQVQAAGINLPSAGQNNGMQEIRGASGVSCRESTSGNTRLEFGIVGAQDDVGRNSYNNQADYTEGSHGSAVYGRISWSLDPPAKLNCKRLMDLEIEGLRAEIEMLKSQTHFEEIE